VADPLHLPGAVAPAPSEAMLLARQAGRGDEVATGRLLRLLAPRLRSVVRAIMGPAHPDLDDALQLALIGFVQALPAFRGECDPAGYASTIAVRNAVAARRRARVRESGRDTTQPDPGHTETPDRIAAARARQEVLRELLADLPPEQAETLAMRVVLGWSLDEIAVHTGAPVNTVRSRMRLAKEAMRRRIEADTGLAEALEVDP